jgi:hypothetical protein
MSILRTFRLLPFVLGALLAAAPAAAVSSATAQMVLTMTFQGAFFTDTMLGALNGTDYELEMFFNGIDNTPQPNTGVGSATSSGSVTINGVAFDDQNFNLLGDGDVIVWTIDAAVTADGAGSSYGEFYQNNTELFADIYAEDEDTLALTFVFDWDVVFNTTLNDDALVGQAIAFTDGTAQGTQEFGDFVLYTDYFDFGFGDAADGFPSTPSGMDSGQLSFFTDDLETSLQIDLENSVFVNATVDAIPEPGTFLLLGAGLTGLAVTGRRRSPHIR